MASRLRLHLDEHMARLIADGRRRRGVSVTTTPEAGLCAATDQQQLAYATGQGRAIVTSDVDFFRLDAEGVAHAGLILHPARGGTARQLLRLLVVVCGRFTAEEMINHVEYL